jgi:predicted transcriptional regulator of viral defense system
MHSTAGIGALGRAELTKVLGSGGRFVTPADVVAALGVDGDAAAKKLSRWAADGWLRRARRGLYIPVPVDANDPATWTEDALVVATAVWAPCYFTGWTSANYWALTEQVFRTTVVKTSARVRHSSARLLDHDYLLSHVPLPTMEWGVQKEWRGEVRLHIADPARTVIDMLDAPELGGGIRHVAEVVAAYLDDHDPATLVAYGDRLGNRAVFKRLGYIAETLGQNPADLVASCRARVSAGFSLLDPSGPKTGARTTRWGLRINVPLRAEGPS